MNSKDTAAPARERAEGSTGDPAPGNQRAALTTTDPQDELFDILDAEGQRTGEVKRRGDVHRDGDWHGALHIWVGGVEEDGEPYILFQRRSETKDTWAGYLDTTIGGHIRSGESLEETVREAQEEIGLDVSLDDLTLLGRRAMSIRDGDAIDREVQTNFGIRVDWPLTAFELHPEEVASLVAIPIADARRLFAGEVATVTGSECPRGGQPAPVTLRREDFAVDDAFYMLAVLAGLLAVIEGRTPEPFAMRNV